MNANKAFQSGQNSQQALSNFNYKDYVKWGAIACAVFILVFCGLLLTRSNESALAFLVKWKSALESGEIDKYDELWGKNARNRNNAGYQHTAKLFEEQLDIDVDIRDAENRTRNDPQGKDYLRIEEIPIWIHAPGEPLLQSRTLTIARTGLIQRRWKLVRDEVDSEEIATHIPEFDSDDVDTSQQSIDSPVAPLVLEWKKALETQDQKKYTSLWDKSARKKQRRNYTLAIGHISQELEVDLSQAEYKAIAYSKTKHLVDNINVSVYSSGTFIETHSRQLTIEKKGFFIRKWRIINDEMGDDYVTEPPISQNDPLVDEPVTEESEGGIFNGKAPLDTKLKVSQILGKWQKAWEDKDLDTYMSLYAEKALITRVTVRGDRETSTYLTKQQLRQKMKRLNLGYAGIQVKISNLIINGDRAVADATFLQEFKGMPASGSRPAYSDIGTKKLDLMIDPADGYWKIYSETWSRYKEVPMYPKN